MHTQKTRGMHLIFASEHGPPLVASRLQVLQIGVQLPHPGIIVVARAAPVAAALGLRFSAILVAHPRRALPQRRYPLVRTPRDEGREPGELVMNLLPGRTLRGGADGRCRVGCAGAWGWRGGVEGGAGRGGAGTGRVRGRTCDTWNPDGYMTVA